jgi:hypothetical protein
MEFNMNNTGNTAAAAAGAIGALVFLAMYLAVIVLVIAGLWKTFTKAGKPGWAAIIPIYNLIVMIQIAGKPIWWIILYLIPFVNIVIAIMVTAAVSRNFGRGVGTTLGLIFLPMIFYPILGFGGAQYVGTPTPM